MSEKPLLLLTKERRHRQEAVDYATAPVELYGLKLDASTQERARLYIGGQLSWKEFL